MKSYNEVPTFKKSLVIPFLLLAIIDLNETLKNVILSIKLRGNEFFLCFFLAFIFMYGLANIAFFYFNSDLLTLNFFCFIYCILFSPFIHIDNCVEIKYNLIVEK